MRKPIVALLCNKRVLSSDLLGSIDISYVMQDYINALERVDCIPVLLPPLKDNKDYDNLICKYDGVLFTGGADISPTLYDQEPKQGLEKVFEEVDIPQLYLAKLTAEKNIPTLGICRGCQVVNVAFGGTLYQDIPREIDGAYLHSQKSRRQYPTHKVTIEEGSLLSELFAKEISTNSFHHQSCYKIGDGLTVTAKAGDGVIEALEIKENDFYLAVQWHPEMMMSGNDLMLPIFERFAQEMQNNIEKE